MFIDWAALIKIIGIDIMLGADNAIVIALACAALAPDMRKKAVLWGTAGAVGLRAVLLAAASLLLEVPYLKIVAGAYLLYVGYKLLKDNGEDHDSSIPAHDRMMSAIKTIIVADFMMSLDNVLAVASAATSAGQHSTLYAIGGIVFSIPIIVFFAQGIIKAMEKFPIIIWAGAGLLGWVGAEMVISDVLIHDWLVSNDAFTDMTHIAYKAVGFVAVIFAVMATKHFDKLKLARA